MFKSLFGKPAQITTYTFIDKYRSSALQKCLDEGNTTKPSSKKAVRITIYKTNYKLYKLIKRAFN